jgi:hypothetical protein
MRNTIWGVILAVGLGIVAGVVIGGGKDSGESALKAQNVRTTTSVEETTTSSTETSTTTTILEEIPVADPSFSDVGPGNARGTARVVSHAPVRHTTTKTTKKPTATTAKPTATTATTAKTTTTSSDTTSSSTPPTTNDSWRDRYCRTDGGSTTSLPQSQHDQVCEGYVNP